MNRPPSRPSWATITETGEARTVDHIGYYIRVLGTSLANIPIQQLRERASPALIEVDESAGDRWEQVVLKHASGPEIAVIEKNPVVQGELGAEEPNEVLDEVPLHRPDSAVVWLQKYLPTVKVIYAFQLLSGTDVKRRVDAAARSLRHYLEVRRRHSPSGWRRLQ